MKWIVFGAALSSAGCMFAGAGTWKLGDVSSSRAPAHESAGLATDIDTHAPRGPSAPELDMTQADRKIIFNGSLVLQVADPDAAEKEIRKAAEAVKGWIHKIDGSAFTLRIPAPQFMPTLEALAKLGRIVDRKVAGTDVTEEFRDLQLRLENAEKLRARISALLEKTKDVKEALDVERELSRVTEEVERLKGRLNAINNAVTYSTIVIALQRSAPVKHPSATVRFPFRWVRELGVERLMEVRSR